MGYSCRGIFVQIENRPCLLVQRSKLKTSTRSPGLCRELPGCETSINRLLLLPQFRPPGQPAVPAKHTRDTNKSPAGSFQKGNMTQKGSRDGKPSQKPVSHFSWGTGPPRGPQLPGRVIAAATAEPWEFRASRRLRAAPSRVRPAVIELRQHRARSPGYLRSLIGATSECGVQRNQ